MLLLAAQFYVPHSVKQQQTVLCKQVFNMIERMNEWIKELRGNWIYWIVLKSFEFLISEINQLQKTQSYRQKKANSGYASDKRVQQSNQQWLLQQNVSFYRLGMQFVLMDGLSTHAATNVQLNRMTDKSLKKLCPLQSNRHKLTLIKQFCINSFPLFVVLRISGPFRPILLAGRSMWHVNVLHF